MPIWVSENKDGVEYTCMCDRCGFEGPPSPSDDEATEGFHEVHEEDRDAIFHCPFCHVLVEEGPVSSDVTVNRLIAVLQQNGNDLSFIPGSRARALVDQLVGQGPQIRNTVTLSGDMSVADIQEAIHGAVQAAFSQVPLQGFSRITPKPTGPFVELPDWATEGALVVREGTTMRIKMVTPSEVVLNGGEKLVVWSRSQRPFDEEFHRMVAPTRADFILEEE